ncbi:Gfo/Idh/MocA family oxidoreductase [Brevundimonas intermedia]|uniref:Gfo/Idh/MocA family oxidoreductase n=1 Tax=Brevundimonas intermedia TaxID=74315 RepID=A0A4Y9RUQ1_9CAUL|nr:Gfo/Idh/MocA family oxidoreductase [Brevundimonas intermedia]TFW11018.1 Gfo/Idh/MocA family oxidoreductase [Brevundimonas intermedia]
MIEVLKKDPSLPAIGVIGAGMVSHAYLGTISRSPELRLKAVSSRTMVSAAAQAQRYGGLAMTTEAMLADPEISVVVNLAPPELHHQIGRAVLEAGKHLYTEKPFATSLSDAHELIALADRLGLKIGCAPDTFLGPGHQAARKLLDDGVVGKIVGGAATMASRGMEHWHPNPAFFYGRGGGPLLDIGPYAVTQLINLLGPVERVAAIGSSPRAQRTVTSPTRAGQTIQVEVCTTVNGVLLFESGANVALTLSWDVRQHRRPPIELYGETGTLACPDPNAFGGEVSLGRGQGDWTTIAGEPGGTGPLDAATIVNAMQTIEAGLHPATGQPIGPTSPPILGDRRGLGLIELVRAIREQREPRVSGRLAAHVLEILLALEACAEHGGDRSVTSRVARPAPLSEPIP